MTLTAKQERFVEEYLIDLNATQAAIRAGYSEKGAHVRGAELLSNRKVGEAITEAQKARSERTQVTQDRVLLEMARVGFSDIRKMLANNGTLLTPEEWDDDTAAAISSIEVVTRPGAVDAEGNREIEYVTKIKTWDKNSALEKMGKHLGMFIDRSEVSGRLTVNVISKFGSADNDSE